jgi:ribosomal protein S12 methylthiotransferase accessory factor
MGLSLRPKFAASAVDGQGLLLFSADTHQLFEGAVFFDLAPLLDGARDEAALADELEDRHGRAAVHYAINLLREQEALIEGSSGATGTEAAFWDELGVPGSMPAAGLSGLSVRLIATAGVDASGLASALCAAGISVGTEAEADLDIVLTDDYLARELGSLGAAYWSSGRSWLLATDVGVEVSIGPFFSASTACYECLAARLRSNRAAEVYAADHRGQGYGSVNRAATAASRRAADHLIILELEKWAAGALKTTDVAVLDLRTMTGARHNLDARPQCPVCGNHGLQSERLARGIDVTTDERAAWQTSEDLMRHVSPVTGVVSRLVRVPIPGSALHCYSALFGFGRGARTLRSMKNSAISQASGVGEADEEARIGALAEAIERYSGIYNGDEPYIVATFRELGEAAIHPNEVALYSPAQFAERQRVNARGEQFNVVPQPFDTGQAVSWTGLWSLTAKRFRLLPTAQLYYHYPYSQGEGFAWADSNGCAAGKTLADAIRRGLLELAERDAVAMWWYNRLRRPSVDLDSFHYPYFNDLQAAYKEVERSLWVLDISNDLGIPTFAAVSRSEQSAGDIIFGFGSDLLARTAIQRALCEMNHLLPAVLPQNRTADGGYAYPDEAHRRWWQTATIDNQPYLSPAMGVGSRRASDYRRTASQSHAIDVAEICGIMADRQLDVLVLDQTQPDVGVPVARVVVPGLRHFWARFAPGRLYDVPVKLGWQSQPLKEADLNPVTMFV